MTQLSGGKLGNKRTINPSLPEGAIVIAVDISDVNSEAAEVVLGEMLMQFGEEKFGLAMDHLYQLFVWDVLTNEKSSLHGVFREAMQKLRSHTLEHLHHSHERIEQLELELGEMKTKLAELSGRVHVLESTLCSVRKCLKSDGVKQAVSFCQRLRKQRPGGEIAEVALTLADGVKDACICIREV